MVLVDSSIPMYLVGAAGDAGSACDTRHVHPEATSGLTRAADAHDPIHPVQLEGLRRMSPARKLEMVCQLYHAGIRLRVAGLRSRHPDWSEAQLEFEARRALRDAGT